MLLKLNLPGVLNLLVLLRETDVSINDRIRQRV